MSIQIKTYGCKVNTYDSSLLERNFEKAGLFKEDLPPVFVLNTCAVTSEATKEAVREVRKLKRLNPNGVVVVTGCAAQVDTDKFSALSQADLVVANSHKAEIPNLLRKLLKGELNERVFKSNIFKKEEFEPGGGQESSHTRVFLKIQDGCNSFCTFCVIPFARGKSRSLSIAALTERVTELYSSGVREVVLTGVHIGDYEFGLENLVEALLKDTLMPRLRLTSLEPIEVTPRLLELFKDDRLCPHFHMSIQSASTPVLKGMKRKYTANEVARSLTDIRRAVPHAYIGMDVIAGFPGEGEKEFLETYTLLSDSPWTKMHVFPYSPRPGTYALKLSDQLDRPTIVRRADRLRELSNARYKEEALKQVGSIKKVLALKENGLSRDFWPVEFSGGTPGTEYNLKITAYDLNPNAKLEGLLLVQKA
jgi:threonylcarbamoyladenosine tRNA methylthiotransferase MtaB